MIDDKKSDFSNVQGGFKSTADSKEKADFSNIRGGFQTTGVDNTPASAERTYTVESGDSLSRIAKDQYGKASKWRAIFEANRDQIDDPDLIHPGQILKIPAIDLDGDGDLD
ncbi:MAG: LysM peptidoglycan-binding domain-containing protein [Lysobacter sp.]|nr:LysM peptidoglycan-binding domain-containing protein [Lysobacter sp.]